MSAISALAGAIARTSFVATTVALLFTFTAADASAQRGGGGSRAPAAMPSPFELMKQQIEANDPYEFLNDNRKALALNDEQRDALKAQQKEYKKAQEPLFKELVRHMPKTMPQGGARGAGMTDTVRVLVQSLGELTKQHESLSWERLDSIQRPRADTLHIQWMVNRRASRGGRP